MRLNEKIWKTAIMLGIALLVLASGCLSTQSADTNAQQQVLGNGLGGIAIEQVVDSGDKVWVQYRAFLEDGTEFESTGTESPAVFIAGSGQVIKGLEDAVIGMKPGDEKNLALEPEDAYGLYDPTKVVSMELQDFIDANKTPQPGIAITINGQRGKILDIDYNAGVVRADLNHPLAGKRVFFWIHIIAVKNSYEFEAGDKNINL